LKQTNQTEKVSDASWIYCECPYLKQTNQTEKVKDKIKMITLNKSMIILPHEEMIEKLEKTRTQRMILFRDLNQYMGSNQINTILERNENRRPILILKELEKTAIHTPTQNGYDTLMQIYECSDRKWIEDIILPTEFNAWKGYGEKTCVQAYNKFQYGDIEEVNEYGNYKIITSKEFYEIQKITQEIIQEISQWFETNKPNRESKR